MIYVKSYQEQAEDLLLFLASPTYNLSREEAVRLQIQRRELGQQARLVAEDLLTHWEGTHAQIEQVRTLKARKDYAIRNNK